VGRLYSCQTSCYFACRTGKFQVTVPVRVDLMQGRLMHGTARFEQTGNGVAGERL